MHNMPRGLSSQQARAPNPHSQSRPRLLAAWPAVPLATSEMDLLDSWPSTGPTLPQKCSLPSTRSMPQHCSLIHSRARMPPPRLSPLGNYPLRWTRRTPSPALRLRLAVWPAPPPPTFPADGQPPRPWPLRAPAPAQSHVLCPSRRPLQSLPYLPPVSRNPPNLRLIRCTMAGNMVRHFLACHPS